MRNLKFFLSSLKYLVILCGFNSAFAHPMPHSMVDLSIQENHITSKIKLPLSELQTAIGMSVNDNPHRLVERLGFKLSSYLIQHIRPKTLEGIPWELSVGKMEVISAHNTIVGTYNELEVDFIMTPPKNYDLRNFYFDYDVILHQVASHRALINVKQDWQQGILNEDSTLYQIGVIEWDIVNNKLPVFQVSLKAGNIWQGFKRMILLGITHIMEGLDHMLFILTLLFPVMLSTSNQKWDKFIGIEKSLVNLIKTITAFTFGHSITLLLGSIEWLKFPTQPIEILITLTIIISALHIIRPIYPKKEFIVAGSFGLIHGLAFSETLKYFDLNLKQKILGILGFNIGIELIQLVIVFVIFPLLILFSQSKYFNFFRHFAASLTIITAFWWLVERLNL